MKNRKGSTLIMTLLVFAVLMIFGTFISSFMLTENKMSIHHQNKTQAYYIARSGAVAVEAAFESATKNMNEVEIENLIDSFPLNIDVSNLNYKLSLSEGTMIEEIILDKRQDGLISIKSKGKVLNAEEIVEIIIESNSSETSSSEIKMENTIFAGKIINSSEWRQPNINGSIFTNSDKIIMSGKEFVAGEFTHEGRDYVLETNKELIYPSHKYNDDFPETIQQINDIKLPNILNASDYISFDIPNLQLYTGSNGKFISNEFNKVLTDSYKYNSFLIDWGKELVIDASDKDVIIDTNVFENRGKIVIKGNKNVIIYVREMYTHDNRNIVLDLNYKGKLKIYHLGNEQNYLSINSNIPGDLYIQEASFNSNTNVEISGSLYHMGKNINSSVSINGNIGEDLYIQTAKLDQNTNTKIFGSLYHFGNTSSTITVKGTVNKDLYFTGAKLNLNDACKIGGNIYQLGNNKNKAFLTGQLKGNAYIESAPIDVHFNKTLEGDIYHFGGKDTKVTLNGSINGNLYAKEADLSTHEDCIINGYIYHNGKDEVQQNGSIKQSVIEIKGTVNKPIYLSEGKVIINSKKLLDGSIYYNGSSLSFETNTVTIRGSIYAPNAKIDIKVKINVEGGVIGDEIIISGYHINIKGNTEFYIPPMLGGSSNVKTTFKHKYFR